MAEVADLTIEELQAMIEGTVKRQLETWFTAHGGYANLDPETVRRLRALAESEATRTRSVDEVIESLQRNRWTPPPGSPTAREMLREDRDR